MNLHLPSATPRRGSPLSNRPHLAARKGLWGTMSTILVAVLSALSVTALSACGGNGGDEDAAGHTAPPARKVTVDFRLESEFGPGDAPGSTRREAAAREPVDRSAVPVDRQAQTRNGRYVSRAVAERTHAEAGIRIVWVDASCCAGLDPELPERIAFGMQAVLGEDAPLYVSGNDLRQAARLADRLDALGLQRVYLVTP